MPTPDKEAFKQILGLLHGDEWFDSFRRYAMFIGADLSEADDAVQNAFAKVYKNPKWPRNLPAMNLEAFKNDTGMMNRLASWFMTVVRSCHFDELRVQKRHAEILEQVAQELAPDIYGSEATHSSITDEQQHIIDAAEALPEREKAILKLVAEGFEGPEISSRLQLSPANVRIILFRVRKQLLRNTQSSERILQGENVP